jgi:ribosomal protein L14E/L6E/L27E
MDIQIGRVVYSRAGRDKGEFLVVVGTIGDSLLVCNGKDRPLERPKKKNKKHIGLTVTVLDSGSMSTNRSLRRTLKSFSDVAHENGI